jgi:3-hydroxy acid dehydrogenase / malonic semialdehyde reductase
MTIPPLYRTALVTGASRGIGEAIVRRLRAEGLAVHAVARDAAALSKVCDATGATAHPADVTDLARMAAIIEAVSPDVLVNNAGQMAALGPLHTLAPEAIDRMIAVDLAAPLHLMRLALPAMISRGHGHIVNIGSTSGTYIFPGTAPYAAAKAGLTAAGRVVRHDLVGTGIRLTELSPGRVETTIYREALADDPERMRKLYSEVRSVQPADIAQALVAALAMPPEVDVSFLEIVPTDQAPGGHAYAKRSS